MVSIILDRGDIKSLKAIIDRFFIVIANESDVITVKIITSSPMNDSDLESLINNIESKLNKKINAIGGIKLMLGNKVVDGSISHQLRKIKYTLEQV